MDATTTRALKDALDKEAKRTRDEIPVGTHEIDETVSLHIKGTMSVLEDEDYGPTAEIPLKVSLALFMRYAGVTGDLAMSALTKAMKEAMEIQGLPAKERKTKLAAIREIADLETAEQKVQKSLDELPGKTRKGRVITRALVQEVSILKGPAKAMESNAPTASVG